MREPAAGDAAGRARRVECRRVHLNPPARLARRPGPNSGPRRRRRRRRGDRAPAHASGGGEGGGSGRGRVEKAREQRIPRALGDRHGAGAGSGFGPSDFLTAGGCAAKPGGGGSVRWMLIAAARASAAFVRAGVRPAATCSGEEDIRWLPGLLGQQSPLRHQRGAGFYKETRMKMCFDGPKWVAQY